MGKEIPCPDCGESTIAGSYCVIQDRICKRCGGITGSIEMPRYPKHDFRPKRDKYGERCRVCGRTEYWCQRDQWEPTEPCSRCGKDDWIPTYDDIVGVMNYVCSECGNFAEYSSPTKGGGE